MVMSRLITSSKNVSPKPYNNQVFLKLAPPKLLRLDYVDSLDFSDVFGPEPVQELNLSNLTLHDHVENPTKFQEVDIGWRLNLIDKSCLEGSVAEDFDQETQEQVHVVGPEDFEVLKVVGEGAFGKVYQVRKIGSSEIFAMKVMDKDKITEKNQEEDMDIEREVLSRIDHPYIVKLHYSFQTKYKLYLVLDFVNGGDLCFQLHHQGLFLEDLARVYAAEIVSAVCHLHDNGIMHRDIKPANILVDAEGHLRLTDFGLAMEFNKDEETRCDSMVGTLEYMAPEIVMGKCHDKAADWWSFGILLYEMLTGKTPFSGGNRQKIQQKIIKDKLKLPPFLTSHAHSLLKGLLRKEVSLRLGNGPKGGDEIKGHKWFSSINWKKLEARQIQPGFVPHIEGKLCVSNFDKCWTKMSLVDRTI